MPESLDEMRIWRRAMDGVPSERRELFAEIRAKLNIIVGSPMCQSETALRILVNTDFEPGSREIANLTYEWRLSRIPFYVEWKLMKKNGELFGVVLQSIPNSLGNGLQTCLVNAADSVIMNQTSEDEEIEEVVRGARSNLPDSSAFNLSSTVALAKLKQAKAREIYENKIVEYLTEKGYGKHDIGKLPLAIAQVLADLYIEGRTGSKYLALTWDEYAREKDAKETKATWADLPTSSDTNTSTNNPALIDIPDATDGAEGAKKKRKRNKKKKNAATTGKDQLQPEPQQTAATNNEDSLSKESQDHVIDSPDGKDSKPEPIPEFEDIEKIFSDEDTKSKLWSELVEEELEDSPGGQDIQAETELVAKKPQDTLSDQESKKEPSSTSMDLDTSLDNHDNKAKSVATLPSPMPAKAATASSSNTECQGKGSKWAASHLVAVPDLKFFRRSKVSSAVKEELEAERVGVEPKTTVRPWSKLRPEAPEFRPAASSSSAASFFLPPRV